MTPLERYMDSWRADFLDPRVGAVRAIARRRVVRVDVSLVQTARRDARGGGSMYLNTAVRTHLGTHTRVRTYIASKHAHYVSIAPRART